MLILGNTASISPLQTISLSKTYSTPNGSSQKNLAMQPAPGNKLRTDEGRRTSSVFAFGGSVFGCNEAKRTIDTRPGILWYEVRVSDGVLLQEGLVDDPNNDFIAPSLALDAQGNIGIGCTRTSASEFPSVYIMLHATSDPVNTMRPPVLALAGTAPYINSKASPYGIGWGNYSSTGIDPVNPLRFWSFQEYANSTTDAQWSTAWVSFQLQ